MTPQPVSLRVVEQLGVALASGRLPADARHAGDRLLERLTAPVRLALLGLPGAGKSTLLNVFAGQQILPDHRGLPSLELAYGPRDEVRLVFGDGRVEERQGFDLADVDPVDLAFVGLRMALPVLERISLLEVVADGTAKEQAAALRWASRRCDIALWCSHRFGIAEQGLWRAMPDRLKDHG